MSISTYVDGLGFFDRELLEWSLGPKTINKEITRDYEWGRGFSAITTQGGDAEMVLGRDFPTEADRDNFDRQCDALQSQTLDLAIDWGSGAILVYDNVYCTRVTVDPSQFVRFGFAVGGVSGGQFFGAWNFKFAYLLGS